MASHQARKLRNKPVPCRQPAAAGDKKVENKIHNFDVKPKPIGKGGFALVFLAKRKGPDGNVLPEKLAIKRQPAVNNIEVELNIGKWLGRHPFIMASQEGWVADEMLYTVMEYVKGGDLRDRLESFSMQCKYVPEEEIKLILAQLVLALLHVHGKNVMHRDIKLENILFSDGRVRLADFGVATILTSPEDMAVGKVGTYLIMAAEMLMGQPYGLQADIWSLGCTIYELAAKQEPYPGACEADVRFRINKRPLRPLPTHYSADLQKLVYGMLEKDPAQRITLEQIFKEPFMQSAFAEAIALGKSVMPTWQPRLPLLEVEPAPEVPTATCSSALSSPGNPTDAYLANHDRLPDRHAIPAVDAAPRNLSRYNEVQMRRGHGVRGDGAAEELFGYLFAPANVIRSAAVIGQPSMNISNTSSTCNANNSCIAVDSVTTDIASVSDNSSSSVTLSTGSTCDGTWQGTPHNLTAAAVSTGVESKAVNNDAGTLSLGNPQEASKTKQDLPVLQAASSSVNASDARQANNDLPDRSAISEVPTATRPPSPLKQICMRRGNGVWGGRAPGELFDSLFADTIGTTVAGANHNMGFKCEADAEPSNVRVALANTAGTSNNNNNTNASTAVCAGPKHGAAWKAIDRTIIAARAAAAAAAVEVPRNNIAVPSTRKHNEISTAVLAARSESDLPSMGPCKARCQLVFSDDVQQLLFQGLHAQGTAPTIVETNSNHRFTQLEDTLPKLLPSNAAIAVWNSSASDAVCQGPRRGGTCQREPCDPAAIAGPAAAQSKAVKTSKPSNANCNNNLTSTAGKGSSNGMTRRQPETKIAATAAAAAAAGATIAADAPTTHAGTNNTSCNEGGHHPETVAAVITRGRNASRPSQIPRPPATAAVAIQTRKAVGQLQATQTRIPSAPLSRLAGCQNPLCQLRACYGVARPSLIPAAPIKVAAAVVGVCMVPARVAKKGDAHEAHQGQRARGGRWK